jgi:serine/threonine-protein kinase
MPDTLAGSTLAARYTLERELGRGGMAVVYLALDTQLHRQVAVKLLHPELASSLGAERFLREIEIVSRLSHPHILAIYDSGASEGRLFFVMPYADGESLRQRLERERQLPIPDALAIIRGVAAALDYAHGEGVIHRDIKPENVLLVRGEDSRPLHPLVADFGIARAVHAAGGDRLTDSGLVLGTPAYMSPEQSAAGGGLDGRSDLYALGCVAYEVLAGEPPFTGSTAQAILARHAVDPVPPLRTVRSTVPEPLAEAIERALAKVPADRFATAGEFANALVAEHRRRTRPSAHHRRLAAGLAGALAIAGITRASLTAFAGHGASVILPATSMAVLPFRSGGGDTALDRLGRDLATTLSATLDGVGGIATTDRVSVAAATARRRDLSATDAAALARRLGARSLVQGTVVGTGTGVRLDLGLFDADHATPLTRGITITASRDSLGAMTDSAAWAILRQVWQRGEPPSPSLGAVTTRSIAALRAFLDGERLMELDHWDDAGLAYQSAVAADSMFWLAQFREQQTRVWRHQDPDSELVDRLSRHRESFPEPDRLLLEAWSKSPQAQLELYQQLTRRFPEYWPGWLALGDYLIHTGPMEGHGWAEAQSALGRAVALNARLLPAWSHMFSNSVGKDTVESARALAGMTAAMAFWDSTPANLEAAARSERIDRLGQEVANAGDIVNPRMRALEDSVVTDWSNEPPPGFPHWGFLQAGFPVAQIDLNRKAVRRKPPLADASDRLRWVAYAWAERGAWDSALATMAEAVRLQPEPVSALGPTRVTVLSEYGLAAFGEWLGALDSTAGNQRRPAVRLLLAELQDSTQRAQALVFLAWFDGMVAFARHDRDRLERARQDGLASGHPQAKWLDRSLRAFGRALAGDRLGAGRELARLEWECADRWDCGTAVPNIAVQRLAAATWLLEAGDSAQAARLLVWHEAMQPGPAWAFSFAATPLAYLLLARIEASQGRTRLARSHYEQFLRRYDSPMPAQRHLVDEARTELADLAGHE